VQFTHTSAQPIRRRNIGNNQDGSFVEYILTVMPPPNIWSASASEIYSLTMRRKPCHAVLTNARVSSLPGISAAEQVEGRAAGTVTVDRLRDDLVAAADRWREMIVIGCS
jgi:hypothetical protein